jgi:hypothetical protein
VIEWNGVNLGRWELASKMKVTVLRFYQGATRKSFNHIPRMVENVLIEDLAILEHESLSFSAARFLGGSVQLWLCRAAHYSSIQNPPVQREQLEKKTDIYEGSDGVRFAKDHINRVASRLWTASIHNGLGVRLHASSLIRRSIFGRDFRLVSLPERGKPLWTS